MMMDKVFRSWTASSALHSCEPGADDATIDEFERHAGWRLPEELRRLYARMNGAELLEGNLNFLPLLGGDRSVLQHADWLRGVDWPIPQELWIVGDNGAGDVFGIWVPADGLARRPVLCLGEIFEPGCMAIVGSSLAHFLVHRTAYYTQLCEGPASALDALDVPIDLRSCDPDADTWQPLARWADPRRPGQTDDPYEARLDAKAVEALLRAAR